MAFLNGRQMSLKFMAILIHDFIHTLHTVKEYILNMPTFYYKSLYKTFISSNSIRITAYIYLFN